MITKMRHIGIAVKNLDEAIILYSEVLGLKIKNIEVNVDRKVRIAIIPIGDTEIELLEPTGPDGSIGKFIQSHGEGLHHIALEVDDIQSAMKELTNKGLKFIDEKPRKGIENTMVAFLHPNGTKVLMELVEPNNRNP